MSRSSTTTAAAVALTLALAAIVSACGGGDDPERAGSASKDAVVTLRMLESTTNQAATEAVVAEFEKANPNIKIAQQYLASDSQERLLLTQLQSGNAPDVFRTSAGSRPTGTGTLATANRLLDLSGESWGDRLYPPNKQYYQLDGKTYSWAPAVHVYGVLYNVELFQELGLSIPTQMSEVLDMCKKITAAGKVPFMQGWSELPTANVWVPQRAAQYVYGQDQQWDEKRYAGQVKFATSPEWRAALQSIADMKDAGCFQKGAQGTAREQSYARFAKGDAVMTMIAAPELPNITDQNPKLQYKMFNLPPDNAANAVAYAPASVGVAVAANTKHPEQAKRYIDYLASDAAAAKFAEVGGTIAPADAASGNVPEYVKTDMGELFAAEKIDGGHHYGWPTRSFEEGLATGVLGLFTGQKTVDQVLEDVDRLWDSES